MISTLQSREFGFGLPIIEDQMMRVNEAKISELYKDGDSANKYKVQQKKIPLQLEHCNDVCQSMMASIWFLFDDGLNSENILKGYGARKQNYVMQLYNKNKGLGTIKTP